MPIKEDQILPLGTVITIGDLWGEVMEVSVNKENDGPLIVTHIVRLYKRRIPLKDPKKLRFTSIKERYVRANYWELVIP